MIPQELKGTGAVPFLEWCNEKRTLQQKGNFAKGVLIADGILDFFLQPFSVDMLVNLIKEPNLATINFDSEGKCTNPEIKEYQQAEDKVIFEGWSMFQDCGIWKYYQPSEESNIMISAYDNKDLYFVVCEDEQTGSIKLNTVNDFITLCNLAEINLTFKK
jgi:hypothetical protein